MVTSHEGAFESTGSHRDVETFDLCVVGAGIAGLNALYVAQEYLPKGARVALVDRNSQCGGMWGETYDYVRLHQPHPMFTVGDLKWNWSKPRNHLASRNEVLGHLNYCLDTIKRSLDLTEFYGVDAEACEEFMSGGTARARVTLRSFDGREAPRFIEAKQVIHAAGSDVPILEPLRISSSAVNSTTPQSLSEDKIINCPGPIYVVGGGKTGMDTVLEILNAGYDREIILVSGKGTIFGRRDLFFPDGVSRVWKGKMLLRAFSDISMRFDGTNQEEIFKYFRETYSISPQGKGENFAFALLSDQELSRIEFGLSEILFDYFEDVVDGPSGPELILRSGQRRFVEGGALFVNCTGHILRHERPDVSLLSPHGTILTISTRAAIHFLTSVSSYFLTHLLYSGKIKNAPIFVADMDEIFRKDRKLWQIAVATQSFLNTVALIDTLPFRVVDRCGLDLDRWHPLHRRLAAFLDIKIHKNKYIDHCKRTLNYVAASHNVKCHAL